MASRPTEPPSGRVAVQRRDRRRVQRTLRARVARRRKLAATLLLIAGVLAGAAVIGWGLGGATGDSGAGDAGVIRLVTGHREIAHVYVSRYERAGNVDRSALRHAIVAALPVAETIAVGGARISVRILRSATAGRAMALLPGGGTAQVVRRAFASRIPAPAVAQALRNNCETASLSVLLSTAGRPVGQLRLQSRIARSGPVDPRGHGGDRIWGDPELGFVGRAAGGGVAGGFGVYQRPIAALSARYGRRLTDLTGQGLSAVYSRLLAGHAVLVWVGQSDGPYGQWRSPQGRRVRVNFGEHAVVLVGVHANRDLRVVNPMYGSRERWSRAEFSRMWQRLGRRALST